MDVRHRHREGDYRWRSDKGRLHLMEIKADAKGLTYAHNDHNRHLRLTVELSNDSHKQDPVGWLYHCKKNRVTDLVYAVFDGPYGPAQCILWLSFPAMLAWIERMLSLMETDLEREGHRIVHSEDAVLLMLSVDKLFEEGLLSVYALAENVKESHLCSYADSMMAYDGIFQDLEGSFRVFLR